jgi:hypothetical protein
VALEVCSRYSGATVPDSHRVPRHLTVIIGGNFSAGFKERFFLRRPKNISKKIVVKLINKIFRAKINRVFFPEIYE